MKNIPYLKNKLSDAAKTINQTTNNIIVNNIVENLIVDITDSEYCSVWMYQSLILSREREYGVNEISMESKEGHFINIQNKEDRNLSIINAYSDGYTQSSIAQYLNVSKSLVSKVIKSGDIIPWVNSF